MTEQNYLPYRAALLTRNELIELNVLKTSRVVVDITILWLEILVLWGLAYVSRDWKVMAVAAALVGNRYYSLYIIGHDGLHRRLHSNIAMNDFLSDVFVLGPLGAITRINRANHMRHHAAFSTVADPDRYKYLSREAMIPLEYVLSLTGISFLLSALRNVYGRSAVPSPVKEKYKVRDVIIVIAWQSALITGLCGAFGWGGYFLMWWLPVYLFTYAADILRVFCEHSAAGDDQCSLGERMVTYLPNKLELLLFAPMNMNHHVAHHLWPSIPYYNLPKATSLLYSRINKLSLGVQPPCQRRSYVRYLCEYFGRCRVLKKATP